jgi:predicted aspartyl protease
MKYGIPFRLAGGAQPLAVVPVTLNGAGPFEFVLDTGAATPVLRPELALRLGVHIDETKEAAGAGGRISIGVARAGRLAVGEASRADVPVIVSSEIERIAAAVGSTLDGVIGYEFLRHFRVTVDYDRLVLVLEDPASGQPQRSRPSLAELPLRLAHPAKPLIVVPVTVDGAGPHTFVLDTGASTTVIAADLAAQLGVRTQAIGAMTGGGGAITASMGVVRSLAIGAAEVVNLPVAVAGFLVALGQVVGMPLFGIVGYNYLRKFLVTMDYPGGILRLQTQVSQGALRDPELR